MLNKSEKNNGEHESSDHIDNDQGGELEDDHADSYGEYENQPEDGDGYSEDRSVNTPEGSPSHAGEPKKKSSNLPYIAVGAVATLVFGGFMYAKLTSGGAPPPYVAESGAEIEMSSGVTMPHVAHNGPPSATPPDAPPMNMPALAPTLTDAPSAMILDTQISQPGLPAVMPQATPSEPAFTVTPPSDRPIIDNPAGRDLPPPDQVKIATPHPVDQDARLRDMELRIEENNARSLRIEKQLAEAVSVLKNMIADAAKATPPRPDKKTADAVSVKSKQESGVTEVATKKSTSSTKNQDIVSAKTNYKLFALRADRVWLRAANGETKVAQVGDKVEGLGVIDQIDITRGAIVMRGGKILFL